MHCNQKLSNFLCKSCLVHAARFLDFKDFDHLLLLCMKALNGQAIKFVHDNFFFLGIKWYLKWAQIELHSDACKSVNCDQH